MPPAASSSPSCSISASRTPAKTPAWSRRPDILTAPKGPDGLTLVYVFGYTWMFLVVMPVLVPYLLARGLTMADVFALQAVYGIAVLFLDIPTGYLCDKIGRRRVIMLGAACNGIGFTLVAAVPDLAWLYTAEIFLGIGWSLVSGADIALIYDILDTADGDRADRRRALANYQLALVLGEASAALLGGALAAWSLTYAAWGSAIAGWVPLAIAALLRAPSAPRQHAPLAADLRAVLHHVLRPRRQRLTFLNMTLWGLSTFIAVWLLQPYWQLQGVNLRWFGLLWGATLLTVGIAAKSTPFLDRTLGPRRLVAIVAAAPVLAYFTMAAFGGAPGIAGGFLFYISRGISSVFLREAFNHEIPSRLRATCNSLASGTFRLAFSLCGPLIGILVDRAGLVPALWVLAAAFAIAFLALALPLMRAMPAPQQ